MNAKVIAQCLEDDTTTRSGAVVDCHDVSSLICIDVSGGSGNGAVKVVGVLNSNGAHLDRYFGDSKQRVGYTEDMTSAAWPKTRLTSTSKVESPVPSFSNTGLYFELVGNAGAADIPDLSENAVLAQGEPDSTVAADKMLVYSVYVKQTSVEAESASSVKIGLYNEDGGTGVEKLHSMRVKWPTYGGAPILDATTYISLSSIEDAGDGWYRLAVGISTDDLNTGEAIGDTFKAINYLGTDGDAASYQSKKIWIKHPMKHQTPKTSPYVEDYILSLTNEHYNIDGMQPFIDETITTGKYIFPCRSYPYFTVKIDQLDGTAANIKVYLITNAL